MKRLIAAIDNTPVARSVLAAGPALVALLEAELQAVHVLENGGGTARAAAEAAGVRLETLHGRTPEVLARLLRKREVAAMLIGVRSSRLARKTAGHVTRELLASARKPLVLVPPEVREPIKVERILAPMDGTIEVASALRPVLERGCECDLEITVVHVVDEGDLPMFDDQPQHEIEAWSSEFLARNCPVAPQVRLRTRVGVPAEEVVAAARETKTDLILLGWKGELSDGRAAVVRAVLRSGGVPAMLIPVR